MSDQFSSSLSSFDDSFGSGHAALSILWMPLSAIPPFSPQPLVGFKVDDSLRATWECDSAKLSLLALMILDADSTTLGTRALQEDILSVSGSLFPRCMTADLRGTCWWNLDCSAALTVYHSACTLGNCRCATTGLRLALVTANRDWSQSFLSSSDPLALWKATRW